MKKAISVLATFFLIFGCDCKNQPENTKPSASPTPSVLSTSKPTITATQSTTPNPTPSFDGTGLDVYGKGIFCEKRENIKLKLDNPLNIAVSKDGSQVYVVNGKCGRKPYLRDKSDYFNIICSNAQSIMDYENDIVENNPIFKINSEKNISMVSTENKNLSYCSLDGLISVDKYDDSLYFTSDRVVYKIDKNNNFSKVFETNKYLLDQTKTNNFFKDYPLIIKNINVENGDIYLDMENGDLIERKENELTKNPLIIGEMHSPITKNTGYRRELGILRLIDKNKKEQEIIPFSNDYKRTSFTSKDNNIYMLPLYRGSLVLAQNGVELEVEHQSLIKFSNESKFLDDVLVKKELIKNVERFFSDILTKKDPTKFPVDLQNAVSDIKVNSKGEIYFNFIRFNQIWKLDKNNNLTLFAGSENMLYGFKDGNGKDALFKYPSGMDIDDNDNLYIADTGNNAIRKITPDGVVSTFYDEK